MASVNRSKLVRMTVRNIGCIGDDSLVIELDDVVCIVGKNNSGKTTVLRAYELVRGADSFNASQDRNQHAKDGQPSEVILEVHIPDGIGNVDNRWKTEEGGLLIVKSRWQWLAPDYKRTRATWDPQGGKDGKGEWSNDEKAGGADSVFSSRLPRAIRIGSLDDADKTEDVLTMLALEPLLDKLEKDRENENSALHKAMLMVTEQINESSALHRERFNNISDKLTNGLQQIFPGMDVRLEVSASPLTQKLSDLVKNGSKITIADGEAKTTIRQQGTGARRAIFWSMLHVKNELTRSKEVRNEYEKGLKADINEKKKELKTRKADENRKAGIEEEIQELEARLAAHKEGAPIPDSPEDPALPGYLLLIDEPENALHPLAARAAQRHLYRLAEDQDWQVIMTTHSPCFINPFENHTTIVRIDRSLDKQGRLLPVKTYKSDLIKFDCDEKQRLQALQHIDPGFSEIFFGSYPILVEGNTEYAAFMASIIEDQHDLINKVTIVRAHGKAILVSLIRIMQHFKISFGVVHDSDFPLRKDGRINGMWTENEKIRKAIVDARSSGVQVRHRVSIPDFERFLGGEEEDKDKPLTTYKRITQESVLRKKTQDLLKDLFDSDQHDPFNIPEESEYIKVLQEEVCKFQCSLKRPGFGEGSDL